MVVFGGQTFLHGSLEADNPADSSNHTMKTTWSKQSGPGEVTFENADSPITTATFSEPGEYTLRLSAASIETGDDSSASDTLRVKVVRSAESAHLEPVDTLPYKIDSPLWNPRIKALLVNWIPHCYDEISDLKLPQGGIANLIEAGKKLRGEPARLQVGAPFANAWVYNTLEAMCLAQMVDSQGDGEIRNAQELMRAKIDEWIPIILAAQEPDGYLQTRFTLGTSKDNGNPPEHWSPRGRGEHEGYVAGYFLEAAIAHYNMTDGKDLRLYSAAKKLADCWYDHLGPPPKKAWYDGHEEMEQALVRFARLVNHVEGTGAGDKYVELAKFLIDSRHGGSPYDQSHLPVVKQYEAVGHAVRAGYFYSALADMAMITGDLNYQSAACSLSDNIVNRKYYLTGGIGSGQTSEGFGPDFALRNNAYCESCSGIAELLFQYKMNLMFRDARFADRYEETLYNAVLGDLDLAGTHFYYQNPLETDGRPDPGNPKRFIGFRTTWHSCPCCVSNISRVLLMLPTWMYAVGADSLYVNLFAGSTVDVGKVAGTKVQIVQATNYPWDGKIAMVVNPQAPTEFSIHLRSPERQTSELYSCTPSADGITALSVNGEQFPIEVREGYAVIHRIWHAGDKIELQLPIQPQRVTAADDCRRRSRAGRAPIRTAGI